MVQEWYENNERFFQRRTPVRAMKEVYKQASRHMERLDESPILKKMRPNESEEVYEYRNDNKRDLTRADVRRWFVKMSRIIRNNVFESFIGSEKLKTYQYEKVYDVFGEGSSYFNWIVDYVLPSSVKDPNLIKVNLPMLADDPLMPPIDGISQIDGH